MPIDSYTTEVSAVQTAGEIQALLASKGATQVMVNYEGGEPTAISFAMDVQGVTLYFRLPTRPKGVYSSLVKDPAVRRKYKTWQQAHRVAWRQVKKWVEAQLAFVEAEQATLPELFLPHAITPEGKTLYEQYLGDRLLEASDGG